MSKDKQRKPTGPDKEGLVYFEIWGMLLIVIAFILLSELGTVGNSLNKFTRLLFGDFYWLTLIFVIYYGVMMIIKHQFISFSSLRLKGIICLSLGILMFSHFPIYHHVSNQLNDSNSNLVALSYNLYMGYLESNTMSATFGGGIIGAAALTVSLMLIGELGTYIIATLLFLAGIAFLFEKTIYDFVKDLLTSTKDFSSKGVKMVTDVTGRMHRISKENREAKAKGFIKGETIPTDGKATPFFQIKSESIPYERKPEYVLPDIRLLSYFDNEKVLENQKDITIEHARVIKKFLKDYLTGIDIDEIYIGPSISTFIIGMRTPSARKAFTSQQGALMKQLKATGIRFSFTPFQSDELRIEIPNTYTYQVSLRETMDEGYKEGVIVGRDYRGEFYRIPFASGFNVLAIGNDINSKIECLKALILQYMYTFAPSEAKLAIFDSTKFELNEFAAIPHLFDELFVDRIHQAKRQLQSLYTKLEYRNHGHEDDAVPILIILNDFTDFYREDEEAKRMIQHLLHYGPKHKMYTIAATTNLDKEQLTPQFRSLFETTIAFRIINPEVSRSLVDIETDQLLKNGDCLISNQQQQAFNRVQVIRLKGSDYLFEIDNA